MKKLKLSDCSKQLLTAQIRLTGTFHHTLSAGQGITALAAVTIDQCISAIHVAVVIGSTRNSVTLDRKHRSNARRVADFIEAGANGYAATGIPDPDEYELASDVEIMLRDAVRTGQGTYYPAIEGLEDLSIVLRPGQTGKLVATIEVDNTGVQMLLPHSPQKAYSALAENLERFIAGHRAELIA